MPPVPSEEGDFSTPLRFGRNDGRGARQHRHLERRYVPVWETDGNRSDDTLSREISHSNAARTIRGGDFSTPLRFGRNDGKGARQHRHLERRCMSVWETDGNRSHDTLSREISHSNAARTIRGGDFSTPLRFRRNDGGSGPAFLKSAAKPPPPPFEPSEPSEPSYNMFGRGRLEDLSLLDLSPLQHEHAFGIMVIGAIEDIPLNPV